MSFEWALRRWEERGRNCQYNAKIDFRRSTGSLPVSHGLLGGALRLCLRDREIAVLEATSLGPVLVGLPYLLVRESVLKRELGGLCR